MSNPFLPAKIAWRYLKAPKSHSAVSAISIISVVGVAVATAAIICVLSVFNGFRAVLDDKLDILAPDVLVVPAEGKTFADGDSLAAAIAGMDGVAEALPSVVDNALAISGSREMPVTLRGVDFSRYPKITRIDSILTATHDLASLSRHEAAASPGVARQLGILAPGEKLLIFAPRREGRVNLANPLASFLTDSVTVADIFFASQSDYDEKNLIVDISVARDLFQYDTEATRIEVMAAPTADPSDLAAKISATLGDKAIVKDRARQQEISFRMVSIEKWVTFLLLVFILIIASFNIISTVCMLVLEKEGSISTLSAIGMTRSGIGGVFFWESLYVSIIGGGSGIVLGLILSLMQQHFGLIRLAGDPDSLMIHAYPVVVQAGDIIIAAIPVAVIGLVCAWTASAFAKSRLNFFHY